MTLVATSERPKSILGFAPGVFVAVALTAAATVGALVFIMASIGLPEQVDELIVENGTAFNLRVEVSDGASNSWLRIGTVEADSTRTFPRVIDQGDVWLFRFHGQGRLGGEISVDRSQMERDGWKLMVPESVSEELRAQGALPSP